MTQTDYSATKDILIAEELAFAIPVIFGNAGLVADSDGKKIIKAGTPISGTAAANILQVRQTVAIKDDTATATMIALHDVDVTDGNANGTALVAGIVDINKCGLVPSANAQGALTKITFMKGE